jgi:hypothetical protein
MGEVDKRGGEVGSRHAISWVLQLRKAIIFGWFAQVSPKELRIFTSWV